MSTPFSLIEGEQMEYGQYCHKLLVLKEQIDEKLKKTSFIEIKNLILWLAKSSDFQKLKNKDHQLTMLDVFCQIWIEEKKKLTGVGIVDDIFYGIDCLAAIENKYLTIQLGILRIENNMPEDYCLQALDEIMEYKVSGMALYTILNRETSEISKNIVRLAQMLKNRDRMIEAVFLLEAGNDAYPEEQEIIMEIADCWIATEQWESAYECLRRIKKPNADIQELIQMIKKVIDDGCN